jgi:hypothetical protein
MQQVEIALNFQIVIWDLDDDPNGNVQHCAQHDVSKSEVEEAFGNVVDVDVSRSTGMPVVFGTSKHGRHLMIVYERIDSNTVYPITAYDVPRKKRR